MSAPSLTPILTPHGRLLLGPAEEAPTLDPGLAERLTRAFERGAGHGLFDLGAAEVGTVLPPALGWWRDFAARFVTAVRTRPDVEDPGTQAAIPAPPRASSNSSPPRRRR